MSRLRIKLSNSQISKLAWVETGVLLSDSAQQLRRKSADVPDIYLTLIDAACISPSFLLNNKDQAKEKKAQSFSINECQKLPRLNTQNGAAYGSVSKLMKASNLPVSTMRYFSHSQVSSTKFTLTTLTFKKMKAFATFKSEIWYLDLTYVDKVETV